MMATTTSMNTMNTTTTINCDDSSDSNFTFESAFEALLSPLHQSTTKEEIEKASARRTRTVDDMRYYWNKIIINGNGNKKNKNDDDDDTPNSILPKFPFSKIIHVTGTKGKGSTACMCESILRSHYGLNTGLFTSPHLCDIRERIRINGKVVSKSVFATTYWTIRNRLEEFEESNSSRRRQEQHEDDDLPPTLPGYFRMLTLMALYIFTHCHVNNVNYVDIDVDAEADGGNISRISSDINDDHDKKKISNSNSNRIDVIIMEVGMGGRYDATNFIDCKLLCEENYENKNNSTLLSIPSIPPPSPSINIACGVTLLDYDHCRVLGNTLSQIAWEKGGIFNWYDKSSISTDVYVTTPRPQSPTSSPTATEGRTLSKKRKIDNTTKDDKDEESSTHIVVTTTTTNSSDGHHDHDHYHHDSDTNANLNDNINNVNNTNCQFFTLSSNDSPDVMNVLRSCAKLEGRNINKLQIVDAQGLKLRRALLTTHTSKQGQRRRLLLGLAGNHQYGNATLAYALCQAVVVGLQDDDDNNNNNVVDNDNIDGCEGDNTSVITDNDENKVGVDSFTAPTKFNNDTPHLVWSSSICDALCSASWPGRCQTVDYNYKTNNNNTNNNNNSIRLYLDGAHTPQSLQATMEWYDYSISITSRMTNTIEQSQQEKPTTTTANPGRRQVLVFYCSHERNPVDLFQTILLQQRQQQNGRELEEEGGKDNNDRNNSNPTTTTTRNRRRVFSDVYFCPPDSQRPSPLTPMSARQILQDSNIPIQEDKLIIPAEESPSSTSWQTTLASVWQHVVAQHDDHNNPSDDDYNDNNTNETTENQDVIFDVKNTTEVLQRIQQKQLQQQIQEDAAGNIGSSVGDCVEPTTTTVAVGIDVLVTGSLYLVGSILTSIGWKEQDANASM